MLQWIWSERGGITLPLVQGGLMISAGTSLACWVDLEGKLRAQHQQHSEPGLEASCCRWIYTASEVSIDGKEKNCVIYLWLKTSPQSGNGISTLAAFPGGPSGI